MSKRSQEKRKARSKEKKLARRRLMGISPLSRLAGTAEETCECWMNCSPDERMISLTVLRPVRGGETVGAFFLIDRDCVGLKDAFFRRNLDPVEVREDLRWRSEDKDTRVLQVRLADARKLVAGAIRWTLTHPFRVPADAERCLKILGGVGDIDHADCGDFGDKNGNMFYLGRQIDLVRCLQGITLDEFMDRDDVECTFHLGNETFGNDGEYWGDGDDDDEDPSLDVNDSDVMDAQEAQVELLALRARLKHKLLDGVRRWCFFNAVIPHPDLEAAVGITIDATGDGLFDEDENSAARNAQFAEKLVHTFDTPARRDSIIAAQKQIFAFMNSFSSPQAYLSALGLNAPVDASH